MDKCIEWNGYIDPKHGYGIVGGKKNKKAHRVAWEKVNGQIPSGMFVLHKCDNRKCINTAHLFLGTYADNNRDCREKGRQRWVDNSGTKHGLSKITEQTAVRIKMLRGVMSAQKVSDVLGMSQQQIHDIMVGKAWKHVTAKTRYAF